METKVDLIARVGDEVPALRASAANMLDTLKVVRGAIYKSKIEDAAQTLLTVLAWVEDTIANEEGD